MSANERDEPNQADRSAWAVRTGEDHPRQPTLPGHRAPDSVAGAGLLPVQLQTAGAAQDVHKMILQDALLGLRDGYDVLLEGILSVKSYREVFAALLDEHPRENYLFYFAVSVEETVRRHRTRQTANLFSEDDMRQWYRDHDV